MTKKRITHITYLIGKLYLLFSFKYFFSKVIVLGKNNIPHNEPIIFAANHRNGLLDALAILYITKHSYSTTFLARADLFKSRTTRTILSFLKILPAFRLKDGINNLNRNYRTFSECIELLKKNNAICIMPEGNQELEPSVRPLSKGIFRLAFSAQDHINSRKSIKIVPVGLDYGNIFKPNHHLIINIGTPIDIKIYKEKYNKNPQTTLSELKDLLEKTLINLTVHIDKRIFDENVLNFIEAFNINTWSKKQLVWNFNQRKRISNKINSIKNSTEKHLQLQQLIKKQNQNINQLNTQPNDLLHKNSSNLWMKGATIIATSPIYLIGLLSTSTSHLIVSFIQNNVIKLEFKGFTSSISFTLHTVTTPLLLTLQTYFISIVFNTQITTSICLLLAQIVFSKLAVIWRIKYKKTISLIKKEHPLKKNLSEKFYSTHHSIINMINN